MFVHPYTIMPINIYASMVTWYGGWHLPSLWMAFCGAELRLEKETISFKQKSNLSGANAGRSSTVKQASCL